jgi:DEAD/DEAH box helicase domain-containing protein
LDLLAAILRHWDTLKVTDSLDRIRLNRLLESELEAALLEALSRRNDDEPERRLEPRVVNGKKGYYLAIPQHGNWLIEPQVDLGPDKGVRILSRADFVLTPERSYPGELPIAVFTDGYEWHADAASGNLRTGRDSAQRLAIARSGRYRVWSLTWSDVQERLGKPVEPQSCVFAGQRLGNATSFDLLMSLLTHRRKEGMGTFARDIAMEGLVANRRDGANSEQLARALSAAGPLTWPDASGGTDGWYCGVVKSEYIGAFVSVPLADVADKSFRRLRAWVRLMDDRAAGGGVEWKRHWREFLRINNVVQFLPDVAWMTSSGLEEGIYGSLLDPCVPEETLPAGALIQRLMADVLDEDVRQIVIAAEGAGVMLPEAGFEIAGPDGEIVALAELAWPQQKICVVTCTQNEHAGAARAAGWTVWQASEALSVRDQLFAALPKRTL